MVQQVPVEIPWHSEHPLHVRRLLANHLIIQFGAASQIPTAVLFAAAGFENHVPDCCVRRRVDNP